LGNHDEPFSGRRIMGGTAPKRSGGKPRRSPSRPAAGGFGGKYSVEGKIFQFANNFLI
jgi:hypothetical protein